MGEILTDSIVALATPHGSGAIAVIRLSGPQTVRILTRCWQGMAPARMQSHTVHLGYIADAAGNQIDQVLATVMLAPKSYTGEDTIELSCHGSPWIQREIIRRLTECGARPAEPGEFTRRAFLNGRLDLTEAEAIADLIATSSRAAQRIALNQTKGEILRELETLRSQIVELLTLIELELDFSEEDVEFASRQKIEELLRQVATRLRSMSATYTEGSAIKEGIPVAIIGATNAGKSSLLNALIHDDKAIVSDIPGTTRDSIESTIEIGDYLYRLTDTAGLRPTTDTIERIGIDRARTIARKARIVIHLIDATDPSPAPLDPELNASLTDDTRIMTVFNKADLLDNTATTDKAPEAIYISAKTGQGLEQLKQQLVAMAKGDRNTANEIIITNARQAYALSRAADTADSALQSLTAGLPADLIAQDLRELTDHLSTLTGAITTPEILQTIFSRFCIGK